MTSLRDDAVAVLWGHGDGTFDAAAFEAGPRLARAVALGDLDGDGRADVVEVRGDSRAVEVRLATAGGLAPPVEYTTTMRRAPVALLVDLDGDHDLDAIVSASSGLAVLRNLGSGTFAAALGVGTASDPSSVAAADLDGDGDLDLAFAPGANNTAGLVFNRGDGTFDPPVSLTVHSLPLAVATGDVDGDGRPDLAVAHLSEGQPVSVLRNPGNGAFGDRVDYPIYGTDVGFADLDGDGALDLVVTNGIQGSQKVAVLRGDGDGGFGAPVTALAPYSLGAIALADLDGDEHPDLALGSGRDLAVYQSRGLALAAPKSFGIADQCYHAAIGDLDGDGKRDVVIAGYPGLTILRNTSR